MNRSSNPTQILESLLKIQTISAENQKGRRQVVETCFRCHQAFPQQLYIQLAVTHAIAVNSLLTYVNSLLT